MHKNAYRALLAFVLLAVMAIGAAFFLWPQSEPSGDFAASGPDRARWKESIDKLGPDEAYRLFKLEAESKGEKAHFMAHVFASFVYQEEGLDGVSVCDEAFSYGCYHGFFAKAAQDRGANAADFASHCPKTNEGLGAGACSHGIGHGLLGYFGYDELPSVLAACDEVASVTGNSGCLSGAFMEYNLRTMENRGAEAIRPFDAADPYAPCDAVDPRYGPSCYFEQSNWWLRVLDADYEKVGALCDEVKGSLDRAACFRGIGNMVAINSRYDVAKSLAACSHMPDDESEGMCKGRAAWSFLVYGPVRSRALELCAGMSQADMAKECPSKGMVEQMKI